MARPPLVSILIPAYNERFFGEALASARAQGYPEVEIVVCDDSPGEAIGALCRVDDARVRYLRNDRRLGFEGNFTRCFREARGTLVKFLNDDDRLAPSCVARLAAAFEDARVTLATSRRRVIDAQGAPRPDIAATTPVARVSIACEGVEMGNLVLMNSLNLIGEPTTPLFRRDAVQPEEAGLFTWEGKSYHCLADLSLWLRVLARGSAWYCADALSDYRVHPGQEQRTAGLGVSCITERLDLARTARKAGFLGAPIQFRTALERIRALGQAWLTRGRPAPGDPEAILDLTRRIESDLANITSS